MIDKYKLGLAKNCRNCGYSWMPKKLPALSCPRCQCTDYNVKRRKGQQSVFSNVANKSYIHVRRRLLERYGLHINYEDYAILTSMARNGEGQLLYTRFNGDAKVYIINYRKCHITLAYIVSRQMLSTALPPLPNFKPVENKPISIECDYEIPPQRNRRILPRSQKLVKCFSGSRKF